MPLEKKVEIGGGGGELLLVEREICDADSSGLPVTGTAVALVYLSCRLGLQVEGV